MRDIRAKLQELAGRLDKRRLAAAGVAVALLVLGFALGRGFRGPDAAGQAPRAGEQAPGGSPGEYREVTWQVPPAVKEEVDLTDPRGLPAGVVLTNWVRLSDVRNRLPPDPGTVYSDMGCKWVPDPDAAEDAVLLLRLAAVPAVYSVEATLVGPRDFALGDYSVDGGRTWQQGKTDTVAFALQSPVQAEQVLIRWTLPRAIVRGWTWREWAFRAAEKIRLKINVGWQIPQTVRFERPVGVVEVVDWQTPRVPGLVLGAVGSDDTVALRMGRPQEVRNMMLRLPARFSEATLLLSHREPEPYPEVGRVVVRVRGLQGK